mgnify:FL=1
MLFGDPDCLAMCHLPCSQLKSSGILERWCDVMLTYHDSCVRATQLACSPCAAMHFGQLGPPEQTMRLLANHMEAFSVSVWT